MRWSDSALTALEIAARNVYWRAPALQSWYAHRRQRRASGAVIERGRLIDHLVRLGAAQSELLMVHSSVRGLAFAPERSGANIENSVTVASLLLSDLISLVGPEHTLLMPTHPHFQGDPGFLHEKSALVFDYSPDNTPSRVGLLNELFRRRPGARRSFHPLSSLSALGPRTTELLNDNLNVSQPLPHGVHSGYYRFCKLGGLVISIGVPFIKYLTVLHVAEEIRDGDWPVRDFFRQRRFRVEQGDRLKEWIVRERRPQFVRSLALGQVRRDLVREGILRETSLSGLRVDTARAADVLAFMEQENRNSTYPYVLPALSRIG